MTEKAIEAAIKAFDGDLSGPPLPMRERMEAAVAAYEAALWQPIETAPTDGTVIIAAFMGQFTWVIWTAITCRGGTAGDGHAPPTHWRPLPASPKEPGR